MVKQHRRVGHAILMMQYQSQWSSLQLRKVKLTKVIVVIKVEMESWSIRGEIFTKLREVCFSCLCMIRREYDMLSMSTDFRNQLGKSLRFMTQIYMSVLPECR